MEWLVRGLTFYQLTQANHKFIEITIVNLRALVVKANSPTWKHSSSWPCRHRLPIDCPASSDEFWPLCLVPQFARQAARNALHGYLWLLSRDRRLFAFIALTKLLTQCSILRFERCNLGFEECDDCLASVVCSRKFWKRLDCNGHDYHPDKAIHCTDTCSGKLMRVGA